MKSFKFYQLAMALLLCSMAITATAAGPNTAWSDADGVYYLKTSDGLEEYTVDGTITFKAVADGSTIASYRDCGVVFSPANEGEMIQITINSIDLSGNNYLLLYDGAIEKIASGAGTGAEGQSRYLPDGSVRWYTSESVGETYTSTSDDGKLSFGFHSGSAAGQTGFNITVTSLSPKDMEYKGIEVMSDLSGTYRNGKNQAIFGVNVITDGGSNALTLDNLVINASALSGSDQVTNVSLYRGDKFIDENLLFTAATVGDNLTVSNVTLKSGSNKFMVVADVLPDAAGSIPSLTLATATVAGEARTPATTTGNAVAIDNVILMPGQATTFTIGEAARFYDDGGPDGKIALNFIGAVTFAPATAGSAIKVDFSKLAIFNTSTIGKNDIFNFYNGREANEANLITTLLTEAETVKSTAADGSMTVTLTSTTGIPADGWEAMVSEFLPGDMTVAGVTAAAGTSTSVAAGQQANMLVVDVMTDNQSNALTLNALNLLSDNAKNVTRATAYYLGRKNVMATNNVFGQSDVSGGRITINGSQELVEGHNYLAIVLDVSEAALNGETIDLTLTSATVGDADLTADELTAQCTVANICHATEGTHGHTIYDEWAFTHTPSSVTPGKYEYQDADYIVTFKPAEAGKVAQMDFSSFDVTYSNTSYGTKAVFEVYSGSSVNSSQLLWALSDAAQATTGPGKSLRSTAADGSMTIRFNPKTSSSYYAASGWMATVTPFQNHAMQVENVTVNQTSSEIVAVGSTDAQVIDFDIVTSGSLTTTTLTRINLDLKGCQDNVARVTVLYNNTADQATAVAFGSVENPKAQAVTVTGERALSEGDNYFWVMMDIKGDAQSEQTVDASLVSVADSEGNVIEVANGDPKGERVIKNMLIMTSGVNVVTVTQPLMFYDDGGPDGNFSKGFDGTITFVPGVENCGVEIKAISFGTGSSTYNKFNVYHGSVVSDAAKDPGSYYATYGPSCLLSKADDGSLTITFTTSNSSYATPTAGWEIEVYLHEYKPLAVSEVNAGAAATNDVVRGSVDAQLMKIEVNVDNDKESVSLNDFVFSTDGITRAQDVTAAKLYFTGKVGNFGTLNLIGTVDDYSDEAITFTADDPITITENGTYYLWLALDLAEDAVVGNTVAARLTGMSGLADTSRINAAACQRNIKGGFHGTYTIGASTQADYPTFAAAVAAMSSGVDGAVRFEVEDGQYAENIEITGIAGTSQAHSITIAGKSGNRDAVVIKGTNITDNGAMVIVDNTTHVTLQDMSFIPANQSFANAILVRNESRYFTLRDSYVKADLVTSGYSGMNLVRTTSGSSDGMNNDYATIEGNTLEGGYIALYLSGPSAVAYQDAVGFVVRGNTITNPRSKSIYMMDVQDALIDGNVINQSVTTATNYNGMDLFRLSGRFVVSNNVITSTHSTYSNGIYLRQECQGESEERPALVYNNSVVITNSPSNSTAGLQINSDARNIHVYYNTVRVAGTGGYCYYNGVNSSRYSNVTLQNNLFQNTTTNGYVALFYDENKVKATQMSNNVLFAATGNIVKDYALTIDDLNSLVGDETNVVEQATFLSDVDSHLKLAGNLLVAQPVGFITTDADGKSRSALTPTVGAYEYADIVVESPVIADGYPQVVSVGETQATVKTKWNVSGKLYSMVTLDGGDQPTVDALLATTPIDYTGETELSTAFNNLTPSMGYKAYFLLVSALDGARSEVAVSDLFTTLRHIDDLVIDFGTSAVVTVDAGEQAVLAPTISGGDQPYTCEWRDQMNRVVGNEATLTVSPDYTWGYKLIVTSADGQTVTAKTGVRVLGDRVVATFDDNYLPEQSYFNGDDENDVFYSGSYAFNVSNMDYWWYGYALSSQTGTAYSGLNDQYHSAAGGGVGGSQFCAAFPGGTTVEVTNDPSGDLIPGVMVTNSAYALSSMNNGDNVARKFTAGDWFLLTIIGTHADGTSGSVEYYLADLRDADTTKHYILDTWRWVDLAPLGQVKSLLFNLSSSDVGQWGMNTPAYVCIDNLGATQPMGDVNCDGSVNIADVTALIDYLLGADANPIDLAEADVNHDGSITIADATALIDLLLANNQ